VIRQPAIVQLTIELFDQYWQRAVTVPGLGAAGGDGDRQLVEMLAAGAKDEQIARALGLSLRTVRRRVAALLADLGVRSRFQAGVEATRRGWL
jgi:DNA-binding CsgD family transcriptional regulator